MFLDVSTVVFGRDFYSLFDAILFAFNLLHFSFYLRYMFLPVACWLASNIFFSNYTVTLDNFIPIFFRVCICFDVSSPWRVLEHSFSTMYWPLHSVTLRSHFLFHYIDWDRQHIWIALCHYLINPNYISDLSYTSVD